MITSKERVKAILNHRESDRVSFDLGSCAVTGMHVTTVHKLRKALGLNDSLVKVIEPYQMLGEIDDELATALEIDVTGVGSRTNFFGFENKNFKETELFGIKVLVPEDFNTDFNEDGSLYQYPAGDKSVPPSAHMPAGGYFHDSIVRQPEIDDNNLNVEDNTEEFALFSEADKAHFKAVFESANKTGKAVFANTAASGFGDIALVPAPWLKNPKGIRDIAEWYMSTIIRKEYVLEIFDKQCEIALENFQTIYEIAGNTIDVMYITGTDFGTQNCLFISKAAYKEMFQPYHKAINEWIHKNTTWKTFIHTCGAVYDLMPHFIESGFDVINPVQCSAAGMEPQRLKTEFGKDITFWGGGIDTQKTLPFGTAKEVYDQVTERINIFKKDGGYVFNPIHNVQACVPIENVVSMIDAFKASRDY